MSADLTRSIARGRPWILMEHSTSGVNWQPRNLAKRSGELARNAPPAGQSAAYRAVQDAVASAEGGRGIGTVYWEPAWTSVAGAGWDPADPASGNAWENQALFDFSGKLLPAARNLSLLSKG